MTQPNSAYLAYPIDQRPEYTGDPLDQLYERINWMKGMLASQMSWVFDPGDAFKVNPKVEIDEGLARINRAALNAADVVVAFLPKGVPTIGVPMEIDRARAQGKIVVVFSDTESYMLKMHGVARFESWDQDSLDAAFVWIMGQEVVFEPSTFGEVLWTGEPEFEPGRAYHDDAGYDLMVSADFQIPGQTFVDVPCGISVELPERTWAMITGRSSTLRKRGLLVHPGIIDTGYRGPLFAGAWNQTSEMVKVMKGERIAQLILFSNLAPRYPMMRVEALGPSLRGEAGFGSSGA